MPCPYTIMLFMVKQNNIKHRKPNRLKGYDYSNAGWYYVTICTHNHKSYFGKVTNGKMVLNSLGIIAKEYWEKIKSLHKNIELDYFVIMPNHIHGIIILNNAVGDAKFASPTDRTKMELSKIIQQFKRAVTIKNKAFIKYSNFKWQRSFYDRIIRNDYELYNIRKYIKQNPIKWELEKDIENLDI